MKVARGLEAEEVLARLLPHKNALDDLRSSVSDGLSMLRYATRSDLPALAAALGCEEAECDDVVDDIFQQLEEVEIEIKQVRDRVLNEEKYLDIRLAMVRNRMLTVELKLATIEVFLGLGAVITGLFGMNLASGWEEAGGVFWGVAAAMVLGGAVGGWKVMERFRENNFI